MAKKRQVRARIVVLLYEYLQEDPTTHKPEVQWEGEILSGGMLEKLFRAIQKARQQKRIQMMSKDKEAKAEMEEEDDRTG